MFSRNRRTVAGVRRLVGEDDEYSVKFDRIFLTAVTASVRLDGIFRNFNGIFPNSVRVYVPCARHVPRVGGASGRALADAWVVGKFFLKYGDVRGVV